MSNETNNITKKKLLYSWRVRNMLKSIKWLLQDDECGRKDIEKTIDEYLDYVENLSDCSLIHLQACENDAHDIVKERLKNDE